MLNYLIRRMLIGCVTLLFITFVVYGLIRNMPGTPLTMNMAESDPSKQISKEDIERLKKIYGLDMPWYTAYFRWLGNVGRLEFGRSYIEKKPVIYVIGQRIGPTLLLSLTSLALAYLLAVPMGLYSSARSGRTDERTLSVILYMLYSIPAFVSALMLLILFYIKLEGTVFHLKPGMISAHYDSLSTLGKVWDIVKHMFLPTICYTYGSLAYYSRFVKSNLNEVVRQDYIRTARAKGVSPFNVLIHHAFRNTLIPFVTLMGLTLPGLLSGSVILEEIFNWPGMGQLFFMALTSRDYETLMGETLMFSVLTLLGQLVADVLYAIVDPRVTYS